MPDFLRKDPAAAYRRVACDAAILGADPRALGQLCFEEFIRAVGSALHADARADPGARSRALHRALAALSGLRLGLDPKSPLAPAFITLFTAADTALRAATRRFDAPKLRAIATDFAEIHALGITPEPLAA